MDLVTPIPEFTAGRPPHPGRGDAGGEGVGILSQMAAGNERRDGRGPPNIPRSGIQDGQLVSSGMGVSGTSPFATSTGGTLQNNQTAIDAGGHVPAAGGRTRTS